MVSLFQRIYTNIVYKYLFTHKQIYKEYMNTFWDNIHRVSQIDWNALIKNQIEKMFLENSMFWIKNTKEECQEAKITEQWKYKSEIFNNSLTFYNSCTL